MLSRELKEICDLHHHLFSCRRHRHHPSSYRRRHHPSSYRHRHPIVKVVRW